MENEKKRPTFARRQEFGAAIKRIKTDYFKVGTPEEISYKGDWRLWHKAIILGVLFISVLTVVLFVPMSSLWLYVCLLTVLGGLAASIGFNVGHDANHGSFSKKKWVNDLVSYSFNFLGVISSFWRFKHNTLHHTYTNINEVDDDVAPNGGLRLHDEQKWKPLHKWQPFYCWFMYGMLYIGWVFKSDFDKYTRRRVGNIPMKITKKDREVFWITKVFYLTLFCVVPILLFGFKAWIAGYFIYAFSVGIITAIIFQMAHVVEKVSQPTEEIATKEEWLLHEVITTANFSTKNNWVSWWVGGLNFQIEHHLFPEVSHIHYKALSEKVKQLCIDFSVPYSEYPTLWSVLKSHFRKMVQLSKKPKDIVVQL